MKETVYALYEKAYVDESGNITDEQRLTYCTDIDEIYWFQGRNGYVGENYFICEIDKIHGEWTQVEGSDKHYN